MLPNISVGFGAMMPVAVAVQTPEADVRRVVGLSGIPRACGGTIAQNERGLSEKGEPMTSAMIRGQLTTKTAHHDQILR